MTTKQKVLEILSQNKERAVSGEKLAGECGVSRAAIWKAVKALRDEGCSVMGTTNGGYVLSGTADVLCEQTIISEFSKKYPEIKDVKCECFKEIDSTNTYAKKLLAGAGALRNSSGELTESGKKYHKYIVVAESQTAGRGRLGRTFYSPCKSGVYLTAIYAPAGGITDPAKITVLAAAAVVRALKKLFPFVEPKIKWINDIFINGKKVCGILTEGSANFETGIIEAAVIGIGVNIFDNSDCFPAEVQKVAGSVIGKSDKNDISRAEVAACIAGELLCIMKEDFLKVLSEYKSASFLIGQNIKVHPVIGDDRSVYDAKVLDIDEKAALVVQLSDGSVRALNSGEVSLHSN